MFRIVRGFSIAVFLTLAWSYAGYAQNMPLTGETNVGGLFGIDIRNTCDPDMRDVIDAQAWEAAQREITQNQNVYVRPDSVLSMTCFDSWLDKQARYAHSHFPEDPDESEGKLELFGYTYTDVLVDLEDVVVDADPLGGEAAVSLGLLTVSGLIQYAMLEYLVLDQLWDVGSIIGDVEDAANLPVNTSLCSGKLRYIEDGFPSRLLGGRARTQDPVPSFAELTSRLDDEVNLSSYSCSRMNSLWHRVQCYDFATEENEYYASGSAYTGTFNHDGIYTYEDYVNTAASGRDYRLRPEECDPPDTTYADFPSATDALCYLEIHGVPADPGGNWLVAATGPIWSSADSDANPLAGTAGAGDVYNHFLSQVSGNVACSAPLRTGFVVIRSGSQYYDAVCPNPGCYFTAPGSLAGTGTCTK